MIHFPRVCRFASVGLLALGTSAQAATLQLVMDDLLFDPGDPVTIRLIGDSQGGIDNSLLTFVEFDTTSLLNVHMEKFAPPTGTSIPWTLGGAPCNTNVARGRCPLINMVYQDFGGGGVGVDPAQEPFTYAVLTATAGADGGVHSVTPGWTSSPVHGLSYVDFFGLTSAPGITFTITGDPHPYVPPPPPVVTQPPPPVVTQPPPDNEQPPRPPGPIYPTGDEAGGGAPIPEPTAALLFAAGLVVVKLRLRRSRA